MHLITYHRLAAVPPGGKATSMGDAALGFETLEPVRPGVRRLGALLRSGSHVGDVVDLNRAFAVKLAAEDVGAPEAEADALLPAEMLAFLAREATALESARSALDFVAVALERYDAPDLVRAGVVQPRRAVKLCAPVPRPGKIIGIAHNYPPAESSVPDPDGPPKQPLLYLKAPSAATGPDDDIALPAFAQQVGYAGALAAVVGAKARCVGFESALDCLAGYCIGNDVNVEGPGNPPGQHFLGRSCDTFAPLGPALVTRDEVDDPQNLWIRTTVSGEVLQEGRTSEMYFSIAEMIHFASQYMTLEPGDVLLTGTPTGCGATRRPPRYLKDGDIVEVEVEGLGRLLNYVRSGDA